MCVRICFFIAVIFYGVSALAAPPARTPVDWFVSESARLYGRSKKVIRREAADALELSNKYSREEIVRVRLGASFENIAREGDVVRTLLTSDVFLASRGWSRFRLADLQKRAARRFEEIAAVASENTSEYKLEERVEDVVFDSKLAPIPVKLALSNDVWEHNPRVVAGARIAVDQTVAKALLIAQFGPPGSNSVIFDPKYKYRKDLLRVVFLIGVTELKVEYIYTRNSHVRGGSPTYIYRVAIKSLLEDATSSYVVEIVDNRKNGKLERMSVRVIPNSLENVENR